MIWNKSVKVASGYGLNRELWFVSLCSREVSSHLRAWTDTGIQTTSHQMGIKGPSLEAKWSWRESDHLPP